MLKPIDNFFSYGETDSKRFGLKILNDFKYRIPEKDITYDEIPAVNGDIIVSQERYKNFELEFHCRIFKPPEFRSLDQEALAISKWLNSQSDYSLLFFTQRPSYLYEAFFDGQSELERETNEKGEITIKFNCKPFVLRQEGLNYFSVEEQLELDNPDAFEARPIIKIMPNNFTGALNFSINSNNFTLNISGGSDLIYIDSRKRYQRVYQNKTLLNKKFVAPNYNFPVLNTGKNVISVNNATVKFEIQPRWRTLA